MAASALTVPRRLPDAYKHQSQYRERPGCQYDHGHDLGQKKCKKEEEE